MRRKEPKTFQVSTTNSNGQVQQARARESARARERERERERERFNRNILHTSFIPSSSASNFFQLVFYPKLSTSSSLELNLSFPFLHSVILQIAFLATKKSFYLHCTGLFYMFIFSRCLDA